MKDIELPPLPDADVTNNTNLLGYRYSYSAILMQAYARAAVEADRAQRVPDGFRMVSVEMLTRWRDAFAEELGAWDIDPPIHHVQVGFDETSALLASTPAPAQQDIPLEFQKVLSDNLWDLYADGPAQRQEPPQQVPASHHTATECHAAFEWLRAEATKDGATEHAKVAFDEWAALTGAKLLLPPQQERKPMTNTEIICARSSGYDPEEEPEPWSFLMGVYAAERHHGIKE